MGLASGNVQNTPISLLEIRARASKSQWRTTEEVASVDAHAHNLVELGSALPFIQLLRGRGHRTTQHSNKGEAGSGVALQGEADRGRRRDAPSR